MAKPKSGLGRGLDALFTSNSELASTPQQSTPAHNDDVPHVAIESIIPNPRQPRRAFRDDLFYRLNVVQITVPALRNRRKDLEPLARGLVKTYAAKHGGQARKLSREVHDLLLAYEFPGNVRELANIIERAVIVSSGKEIEAADLPEGVRIAAALRERKSCRLTLAEVEAEYIRETLAATKGNKTEAARILGISRKNLYERLARDKAEVSGQESEVSEPQGESNR